MIERVKLLMSVKNLSSAQLAETIGVQRSGISHILSGRNKPSLDFVVKVLEAYPNLNESWLLKGEGEMLKNASVSNSLFSTTEPKLVADVSISTQEDEVVKTMKNTPTQVNDEDRPHYGTNKLESQVDSPAEQALKSVMSNKVEADSEVLKTNPETIAHNPSIEGLKSDKKLMKLIAIYSDDSFKVYHLE